MKKILKTIQIALVATFIWSCGNDEFPVPEASTLDASFTYNADETVISFTNETRVAEGTTATYNWNFGDGTSSNEQNPVHAYKNVGIYTVNLVVTSSNDVDSYSSKVVVLGSLDVRLFYINGGQREINELRNDEETFAVEGTGYGVDYDAINGKVYFTDATNGTLMRSDLDGSEMEEVAGGFTTPRDLAVDTDNNKIYVVDRAAHEVVAVNPESGAKVVLYSNAAHGLGELPVGIDYYDGNVYITCVEIDAEAVWKGPVNGSGVTRIINYSTGGYGYAIAVDKVNEKIYFDNHDKGQIMRANLDGTGVVAVADKVGKVYGIAVDNTNNKIYWSDTGDKLIKKANLDGSDVVAVSLGLKDPLGIFIIE